MPPRINVTKCIGCNTCASLCCMNVFGPPELGRKPKVLYPDECWHCRACVMECPVGAIELRYPLSYMILYQDAAGMEEH